MSDISETISAGQLRAFIERIERLEEEIKTLNGDKSEVYKELRGCGFDVKAVRQCVAARKLDSAEREERTAIFDLYWNALTGASRVHVHEADEITNPPDPLPPTVDGGQPHPSPDATGAKSSGIPAAGREPERAEHRSSKSGHETVSAAQGDNPVASASEASATNSNSPATRGPRGPQADSPASTSSPEPGTHSDDFTPPAFLAKQASPLRPHCLTPDCCAGYGSKHCHACLKARDDATVAA